jgi:hypothetical protein
MINIHRLKLSSLGKAFLFCGTILREIKRICYEDTIQDYTDNVVLVPGGFDRA